MKFALSLLVAGAAATAPVVKAPEHGIDNRWIVLFENHNFEAWKGTQLVANSHPGMMIDRVYNINNGTFLGVAGEFSDAGVQMVAELPGVRLVEQDALAFTQQTTERPISAAGHWGLDRADGTFDDTYRHPASAGEGATVYILDTGIRTTHQDYGGRARFGQNFTPSPDGDRHGHGTHCGCTATGTSHGVASSATVIDVKVLGDSGSGAWSGVIEGIAWADDDCERVCAQSLSLGGGANTAVDEAVNAAAGSKSAMIIASGNSNGNSCNYSPARAEGAFTVNSAQRSGSSLTRSSFSNYGTCSQAYSAGSTVLSCGVSSDTATATMSGTSMATPHVAGAAAECAARLGATTVDQVYQCLHDNADPDAVAGNPSGPNDYVQYTP